MCTKLVMVSILLLGQIGGQRHDNLQARIGDVANGKIDSEQSGQLLLNVRPCEKAENSRFVLFRSPYSKREEGEERCPDGTKYTRYQVEQE